MGNKLLLLLLLLACVACEKRDPAEVAAEEAWTGRLLVNEVMVSASGTLNEFGEKADWFEVYNPGTAMVLEAGAWFVTDDPKRDPMKYELPEVSIVAGEHLVIWCDKSDKAGADIHARFKLSPKDGQVAIVHRSAGEVLIVDSAYLEDAPEKESSLGRCMDGAAAWCALLPTPGAPNVPQNDSAQ